MNLVTIHVVISIECSHATLAVAIVDLSTASLLCSFFDHASSYDHDEIG